jgi:hypothetical protein
MIVHRYPKAWRRGITHSQGLPLPFNHCFQKDCNLRISAKKLVRHTWMLSAKKQMADRKRTKVEMEESRPLSNYNFDEAVLKVQEWNEALRCECFSMFYCTKYNYNMFCSQRPRGPQNMVGKTNWTSLGNRSYSPRQSNHGLAILLLLLSLPR